MLLARVAILIADARVQAMPVGPVLDHISRQPSLIVAFDNR
jgi:hypothetical protein